MYRKRKTLFQGLTRQLNCFGDGVVPPVTYATSTMQQWALHLKVSHLCESNRSPYEIRKFESMITFKVTRSCTKEYIVRYLEFSSASHGHRSSGQTGYISALYFQQNGTFHIIGWNSSKQGLVSLRRSSRLHSSHQTALLSHVSSFQFYTTTMTYYHSSSRWIYSDVIRPSQHCTKVRTIVLGQQWLDYEALFRAAKYLYFRRQTPLTTYPIP